MFCYIEAVAYDDEIPSWIIPLVPRGNESPSEFSKGATSSILQPVMETRVPPSYYRRVFFRVFNTIRKVNVNCSLEIFRTFSCFAASTAHQDRNRTKTGSINMTAPQHHIEPTFSTHPTVDNFEANMFHFCSRLAFNHDHNLLEKKQLSLLWTWPLCCSIPRQNRHSKTTLGCFTVDCFVLDPWLAAWASVLHKHPKHSVGTTRTSLLTEQNRLQRKGKQK